MRQIAPFALIFFLFSVPQFRANADPPGPNAKRPVRGPDPIEERRMTIPELPTENHKLSAAERARLRVKWSKPKIITDQGRKLLEINGQMLLASEDGKTAKPINWPQPVLILLTRSPAERPDWSEYHRGEDTASASAVTGWKNVDGAVSGKRANGSQVPFDQQPAGEFTVYFELREIQRSVKETNAFQLGLCLGVKDGKKVSFTSYAPALTASVTTVEIQAPPKLSRTLQLINACPTPNGWDYNPVAAIRAANHLRALGKAKAVAALREFLEIARDPGDVGPVPVDPTNIDTSNQWCVAMLVPLVFEPAAPNGREPDSYRNRITIQDGIPFHGVPLGGGSGWPDSTVPKVDWAEKNGRIIKGYFEPTDNPLAAAEKAFAKLAKPNRQEFEEENSALLRHLRAQAWRMVQPVIEGKRPKSTDRLEKESFPDAEWAELKSKVAKLKIKWDKDRQEYRATNR